MHQSVMDRSNRVRRALSHFHARQNAAADHVVWVYAITDDLVPDQLAGLTGVGGEEVRAVCEAGLTAVVGSVDAQAFGEQARADLMSNDLARLERLGRAHHQVIACVAAEAPVLPLRLATVYPNDQTVRGLLARSGPEFSVILDSFRGTEEWGVKVYADGADTAPAEPAASATSLPDAFPSLGDWAAGQAAPGGPGDDAAKPVLASGDAEAFAEMIDRALTGIAIASRHYTAEDARFDGNDDCLVLNASYLVLSDRAGEFTTVARALTRAVQGMGAGLTGPWPPYSFADILPG